MKIRFATDSDLEFVIKGLESTRAIEQRPKDQIPASLSDRQALQESIKNREIRVVDHKGNSVAFLCFKTNFTVMYIKDRFLWIDLVYVDEEHRGKGLGKMLYDDVAKIAQEKNVNIIALDVFAINQNSLNFHKKLGFEPMYTIYTKRFP